ncbi:MAG: TetR/AcrR family transcriptional regulator [Candidatus Heimdallarchaeota archaeon]|nr:TetR/AcrR family transcriptional regulator [Candidatus Heimdallarchaeota archaeon]
MAKSRRQRVYDSNRIEIIKAARTVFAQKGYDKATISEIAKESDFSVGTIYNFFESKKDLFEALQESEFSIMIEYLHNLHEKYPNPMERMLVSFNWVCELYVNKEDLMKLWFDTSGCPFHNVNLTKNQTKLKNDVFNVIQNNFKQAIDEGYIKDIDPYFLAIGIHSLMYSYLYDFIENPGKYTLKEIINFAKKIFFESVVTEKGKFELSEK